LCFISHLEASSQDKLRGPEVTGVHTVMCRFTSGTQNSFLDLTQFTDGLMFYDPYIPTSTSLGMVISLLPVSQKEGQLGKDNESALLFNEHNLVINLESLISVINSSFHFQDNKS